MDFDQYVAARYGRLIEHAVLLGCAEGQAGLLVDRVLVEQRKRIRRADDPDPLVREALEREITGTPQRTRRTGPWVALGAVAVVVAVATALTYRPAPQELPSLFAMDASQARQLLEHDGYDVLVRPDFSCEPQGLVLGSDPPAGQLVQHGGTVTLHTAKQSGGYCPAVALGRDDGWAFVEFALGGPPPMFADTVRLIVDGGEATTLRHDRVGERAAWGHVFGLVSATAHQTAPTPSGMPDLHVDPFLPPVSWCGVPRPAETGQRFALRLEIDTRAPRDEHGCPLTIDLYRSERVIDTVVVYTAKS